MNKQNNNEHQYSVEALKRRRASLFKIGSVMVLAFIVWVFSSIAWFTSNKDVTAGGAGVQVVCEKGYDIQFRAFRYDLDTNRCIEIQDFDIANNTGLLLGEYDAIFTDRNQYAGILLRLDIDGDFTGKNPYLKLYRRDRPVNSNLNYVSEAAKFQVANENVCQLDDHIDKSTFWGASQDYFGSQGAPQAVSFQSGLNFINMSFTASAGGGHTVLWLLMEYNDTLVRTMISNQTLSLNQLITVEPDCTIIQLMT